MQSCTERLRTARSRQQRSPSEPFIYPPLSAYLFVPFTLLPTVAAEVIIVALVIAAVPATLLVLGVRDWRCYAIAFLWWPTIIAIQTANVTLPLLLGLALVWRYRDRRVVAALVLRPRHRAEALLLAGARLAGGDPPLPDRRARRGNVGAVGLPAVGRHRIRGAPSATRTSCRPSRAGKGRAATRSRRCSIRCCRTGPRTPRSRHCSGPLSSGSCSSRAGVAAIGTRSGWRSSPSSCCRRCSRCITSRRPARRRRPLPAGVQCSPGPRRCSSGARPRTRPDRRHRSFTCSRS